MTAPSISSLSNSDFDVDFVDTQAQGKTLEDTVIINGSNFGTGESMTRIVRYKVWSHSTGAQEDYDQIYHQDEQADDFFSWTNTQIKLALTHDHPVSHYMKVRTPTGGWSNQKSYNVRYNTITMDQGHHCYWSDDQASDGIPYWFNLYVSGSCCLSDMMWKNEMYAQAVTATDSAYKQWENVTYSDLSFDRYAYTTSIGRDNSDGNNVMVWEYANVPWGAATYVTEDISANADTLTDVDIVMNCLYNNGDSLFWSSKDDPGEDTDHPWRDDPKDVWDVMSHEIGHLLGTHHVWGYPTDTLQTMYYTSSRRDTLRRTLTSDDEAFVKWLYESGTAKTLSHRRNGYLLPHTLYLEQNYPNPFNPQTTIGLHLEKPSVVTLEIYNAVGQKIRTLLANERLRAGDHQMLWDSKDEKGEEVSSGVYIYKANAEGLSFSKKMSLVR